MSLEIPLLATKTESKRLQPHLHKPLHPDTVRNSRWNPTVQKKHRSPKLQTGRMSPKTNDKINSKKRPGKRTWRREVITQAMAMMHCNFENETNTTALYYNWAISTLEGPEKQARRKRGELSATEQVTHLASDGRRRRWRWRWRIVILKNEITTTTVH